MQCDGLYIGAVASLHTDIEQLQRHTVYNGWPAHSHVSKFLFKALHSFNSEERQMFIRFVWGRYVHLVVAAGSPLCVHAHTLLLLLIVLQQSPARERHGLVAALHHQRPARI